MLNKSYRRTKTTKKPDRVLMVVSSVHIGGGVQTKIMDLYRRIDKDRVQFDFLVHTVDSNKNSFTEEILSLGGTVYFFGKVREIGVYNYLSDVYKLIKHRNYKVVHSYMGMLDGLFLFIARLLNVKIRISHVRTIVNQSDKRKLFKPLLRILIKKNHTLLLASSVNAGKSLYGNEEFEVIPNALEIDRFLNVKENKVQRIKEDLNITEEEIVLGHIGRFSYEKNHKFLLKIALKLKEKSFPFKIILVGDGELRESIENDVNVMDLKENICFVGVQPNPEVYYSIFDIFLFPSYHEGFGNVAVEAQISRNFVIASKGVSTETNLGFDMITYLSVNNLDEWINKIIEYSYSKAESEKPTDQKIRDTLNDSLFTIDKSIEKYYSIYNV